MLASISPDSSQFFSVGVRIGCLLAKALRNSRSEGLAAPRPNSARTTDEVRMAPMTDWSLSRRRGDRRSSMMTDESKMTRSINVPFERSLIFVLLHQGFEALQRDDLAQGDVNGICAGFRAEDFYRLVCQFGVQADRCHGYGHGLSLISSYIHTRILVYTRQGFLWPLSKSKSPPCREERDKHERS